MRRDYIAIIASGVLVATLVLSTSLADSVRAADDGPNMPHLASVKELEHSAPLSVAKEVSTYNGMLYDESSVVRGTGDISIKGSFEDRAIDYTGWMKGTGSINFESLRSMNKKFQMVNFTQKSDLVFEGGQLKSDKSLESPLFYRGIGASINERFNLSHVDKSETDMIRSNNRSDNTLAFNVDQAFEGIWNIKNQQGWLFNAKKSEQQYSGSFQTQKNIEFRDLGKKWGGETNTWKAIKATIDGWIIELTNLNNRNNSIWSSSPALILAYEARIEGIATIAIKIFQYEMPQWTFN